MRITQYKLTRPHEEGKGILEQIVWTDSGLKVGQIISLKNQVERWTVAAVYSSIDKADLNREWKVGGLI